MTSPRIRWDLIAWRPLRALLRSPLVPLVFQVLTLAAVVFLVINGLGVGPGQRAEALDTLKKTNLTSLLVWGLWWPGMIVLTLTLGRAWCTVCPMELVSRLGDELARRVGWPRARLGAFLRGGWMILVAYLVMQALVAGASVNHVPHRTTLVLLGLLGVAFLTGLVFREPRSFCRAFCPAGALLSVYGRRAPFQLEARDGAVCETCPTKDCVQEKNRHRLDARSCPSLLRPFHREPSDGCVLCMQCVKVCPYDNMGWGLLQGDAPLRREVLLKPYEAVFIMVALGSVMHETIEEVKALDALFMTLPDAFVRLFPSVSADLAGALWFLVLVPLLIWIEIVGFVYLLGYRGGWRSLILAAATGAAPVIAAAHLAKAVVKIASSGGYLPLVLRDPGGVATLQRITDHTLTGPGAFGGLSLVGWIMLPGIAWVTWRALRRARELPPEALMAARVGSVTMTVLFGIVLGVWAFLG